MPWRAQSGKSRFYAFTVSAGGTLVTFAAAVRGSKKVRLQLSAAATVFHPVVLLGLESPL